MMNGPKNLRWKSVLRWDPGQKKLRLARLMWERGAPGFGGHSAKLALSLTPKLWSLVAADSDVRVTVLGCQVHYRASMGGLFV